MVTLVQIIGILLIVEGIIMLMRPEVMRKIIVFFSQGMRIYIPGVIRLILAIVFLLAASRCARPWVIIVFGILMLLGGLMIFAMKPEKIKTIFNWWLEKPLNWLRVWSILAFVFGALIVYAA